MKTRNPAVIPILWDYKSAFYFWGILASAGAYVFAKAGTNYDLQDIGIANPRATEGLSEIIALIKAGVLPKSVSYSVTEELMGQGKLAMTISGPWAWRNLVKSGIDIALAPIPGVHGKVGRPFVGVSVAYLNRSSPNQDLTEEFLENYFLTEQGLRAADDAKPIGVPALISLEIDRHFELAYRQPQFPSNRIKNLHRNPKSIVLPWADSAIDSPMSNLIVLDFDGIHTADEVLNKLRSLQKEQLIDLEDACVVERDKDGKVHIKQAVNMTALGAARGGSMGALWGTLVGLLFLNPLAGMVIGAAAGAGSGALSGSLTDYGINDDFVKKLGATIPVNSSALFVLVKSVTEDKVIAEIESYKPRVLKTSLSNEDEAKLKAALRKVA